MTSKLSDNLTQSDNFFKIKNDYESNWDRAQEEWGSLWSLMDRDIRAYAGNTWTRSELNQLAQEQREALELPVIRSKVNWFTGYQRDNVRSINIEPVENNDQETADQFSNIIKQIWYRGQGQYHWNQAFEDTVKTGLSLFGIFLDLSNDTENGDIKFFRRGYPSFALDPDTENPDLSDCSWAILRDFVTRDQAKSILPFVDDDVIDNVSSAQRDEKFTFLRPYTRNYNNTDIITYDQYYRRVSKRRRLFIEKESGNVRDITEISKDQLAKLESVIDMMSGNGQPKFEITHENRESIEYNVILSGEVVFSGKDALGLDNKYPFVPILCFFEPSIDTMQYRYQGIVRSLVDAQRIFNKRNMKTLDIMDKIIYGSTKYMLGAVDDPRQLIQSGSRRLIGIQPGYTMQDVEEIPANTSGISEIIQYSQVIDNLFNDLAGINETLLGADEGGNTQVSGRLAQVRTANGVRANRKIFDQLDFSQKLIAQMLVEAIQINYSSQKISRMLGEEPTEQFFDKDFEKFDAVVKPGIESITQKDQYYFELVNLKREGIVDVPEGEIIRALPMVGKSDLLESIKKQEEANKEQQQKTAELEQIQKELLNAQTEQSIALSQERRARVVADIGLAKERASESEQNRSQAALDKVKAMVEIQNLTQDQLIKVISFIREIESKEDAKKESKEADILREALGIIQQSEDTFKSRGQNKQINAQQQQLNQQQLNQQQVEQQQV